MVHREESGISCVRWSPARPSIFAAATLDGALLVYDLKTAATVSSPGASAESSSSSSGGGAGEPARTLLASENYRPKTAASRGGGSGAPALTAAAFAAPSSSMAAAGDALGRTHVWKLDAEVAAPRPSEIKLLDKFITVEAEEQ